MKNIMLLGTLAIASILAGEENHALIMQKGEKAATALVQKLGGELKAKMQSAGPVEAVKFCSNHALSLTEQTGIQEGVKIRRVTLNERNPVNAPTPSERALLQEWTKKVQSGEPIQPKLIENKKDQFTYYKPLLINNDVCLKCHGTLEAESALAKAIKETYPNDRATGYKMGDLRGMIAVTISTAE